MDALSRLHPAAGGLLALVDDTLAHHGCRADHPIWPLLRECGRLPGDALSCAAGWLPDELDTRAQLLIRQRDSETDVAAALTATATWEGDAATAFEARLAAAHQSFAHLDETGRLMTDWFTELSAYLQQARLRLAHTLGRALHSAEAVTLKVGPIFADDKPAAQAEAAATIGTLVLTEVDLFWQGGVTLSHYWSTRLDAADASASPTPASTPTTSGSASLRADL